MADDTKPLDELSVDESGAGRKRSTRRFVRKDEQVADSAGSEGESVSPQGGSEGDAGAGVTTFVPQKRDDRRGFMPRRDVAPGAPSQISPKDPGMSPMPVREPNPAPLSASNRKAKHNRNRKAKHNRKANHNRFRRPKGRVRLRLPTVAFRVLPIIRVREAAGTNSFAVRAMVMVVGTWADHKDKAVFSSGKEAVISIPTSSALTSNNKCRWSRKKSRNSMLMFQ